MRWQGCEEVVAKDLLECFELFRDACDGRSNFRCARFHRWAKRDFQSAPVDVRVCQNEPGGSKDKVAISKWKKIEDSGETSALCIEH
jgi:hypothetical protein